MLTLTLLTLLAVDPKPAAAPAPPPEDFARLYFVAGDVARAQEVLRPCLKTKPKICKPLHTWLVEYAFVYAQLDSLTPEQAAQLLAWDVKINPKAHSRLTEPVIERFVNRPLQNARTLAQGDPAQALKVLEQVLRVDPGNAEARTLREALREALRADGGL